MQIDRSQMTPPQMQWITATLGWCGKAVDSLADRLVFQEFKEDNFDINQIFQMNNPDTMFDSAILSALISSCCFIYISSDEDGEIPVVGQFNQQSMTPYIEQLRTFAALFAGETGLTLDDLGFVSENPSSAEAIKAAHENLRLAARKAQRTFGSGFLNVGYLAACLRDDFPYQRKQLYLTKPVWEPIFEPDAAMLSSIGDGAIKINQAVPGYFNSDNLRNLTGVESGRIEVLEVAPVQQKDGGVNE